MLPPTAAFVVVGDNPLWATGLGRICRDLVQRVLLPICTARRVPLYVASPGMPDTEAPWRTIPLDLQNDWGSSCLADWWQRVLGPNHGTLFTIWDPSRCFSIVREVPAWQRWGYVPLDAENLGGGFTGPTADTLRQYQRVLAYTRWGAEQLQGVLGAIAHLPHGLNLETWQPQATTEDRAIREALGDRVRANPILIGGVAANQFRKDLGTWAQALRLIRDHYHQQGQAVVGWLHTDRLVKEDGLGWSVPQLLSDTGLLRDVVVTTTLSDDRLAAWYRACTATIAPGLGEGFGYPIVESLACGTPVVHHGYGGGSELVPDRTWRAAIRAWRLEGIYTMVRPVLDPQDVANATIRAIEDRKTHPDAVRETCVLSVAHLGWDRLVGRWQQWIEQGWSAR